ncbi:NshR/TsnR family 23S rRNA methyltransferase [Cellulomonas sp. Sa3CUA2]|uniref:NshR/TsnR family 23S rRNA methyltransferase n=1 Tax=Cellulomonas avistercoris TaxID=2762242 RepID=A0ABR8QFT7_9CELL|nr:TrmH family RNA methyltransferase [Cellulomonas avistercoris]MBD7919292.1 NshR/TsnR family 23S rRNA methyltransferase [Cellulomonas avistercoris]
MTDVISSRSDPQVQRIDDLVRRPRAATRTLLVEDPEPLAHALTAGVEVLGIYAVEGADVGPELGAAARTRGVTVQEIATPLWNELFRGDRKPDVVGVAKTPRPAQLADLAERPGDVVVLDGVRIVGNIGAAVRTAYALGAAGVVLVDSDLAHPLDRRVVRASRGYVFSLPVVLASREEAVAGLRELDLPSVAFDAGGELVTADLAGLAQRLLLVFGSEKRGASAELTAGARTVSIPMRSSAESLNVSVAVGIALGARAARNLAS